MISYLYYDSFYIMLKKFVPCNTFYDFKLLHTVQDILMENNINEHYFFEVESVV